MKIRPFLVCPNGGSSYVGYLTLADNNSLILWPAREGPNLPFFAG